ncbi:MAG: hypothetical protein AMXMBFR81_28060 [Chthonomonas sp.]
MKRLILVSLLIVSNVAMAQSNPYADTTCAGCHGSRGEGGMGPAIANTQLSTKEFLRIVRDGKGIMPGTSSSSLSDAEVEVIRNKLAEMPDPALKPLPVNGSDVPHPAGEVFSTSTCVGCHGMKAMGGLGPPIVKTKLTEEEFLAIVRKGRGMMPGTPATALPDDQVEAMRVELQGMEWDESQIPIAFKVGSLLTTRNMAIFFSFVTLFAAVFGIRVLAYWLGNAGFKGLRPKIARFGWGKATWVFLRSLIVDGLLVASLYRTNKARWFKHGLMLYGFLGLMLGDVLMQVVNPQRGDLAPTHPLKAFLLLCGAALLTGVVYVFYRYKTDRYIDNGLTMGRDFLFVNLLLHTVVSGFMTMELNRVGAAGWIMPIYLYHLASVGLLIATAPFTRFNHVFVVPVLAASTALVEAIVASEKDLGFRREPSPGRDHKTQRIAHDLLTRVDPENADNFRIRYYP